MIARAVTGSVSTKRLGDELFSLTPADFLRYDLQSGPSSRWERAFPNPVPLPTMKGLGVRFLGLQMSDQKPIPDGTNLPMVVEPTQATTYSMKTEKPRSFRCALTCA